MTGVGEAFSGNYVVRAEAKEKLRWGDSGKRLEEVEVTTVERLQTVGVKQSFTRVKR